MKNPIAHINPVIKFLALSNVVTVAAVGLFGPLFAVYITEQISSQNILEVIGLGSSIFLLTRSLGQIPVAYIIDRIPGEIDDFWVLLTGNFVYVIVPILYLSVSEPWHLFTLQAVYGLGAALAYPTWSALFTKHIDTGKEAIEWGSYHMMSDLAGAAAASAGGIIASLYGFDSVFIAASGIALIGCGVLLIIRNNKLLKDR